MCGHRALSSAPWNFQENISTQQSTWMALEDGSRATVALEDGGNAAALGAGIGRRFKIAAAALGRGGGGRRMCDDGVGISVINARIPITTSASASARTAREDAYDAKVVCRQQWQGDRGIAAAVAAVRMQRWCRQGESKGTRRQTSTGKARAMQQWRHQRGEGGEEKRLDEGTH
jgi:hypothetical protein